MASVWWGCTYPNSSLTNTLDYYYLPQVPPNRRNIQDLLDAVHTICFVGGGAIGGLTGHYWYGFLTR